MDKSPLEMSDEDFLKLNGPPPVNEPDPAPVVSVVEEEDLPEKVTIDPEVVEEEILTETVTEKPVQKELPNGVVETGTENRSTVEEQPINYEEQYNRLMAPFKANGKMITLNSPEELIQLAQMGANYTRKMQDIQPHRKVLQMLENNGLLDEGKLSFLIDLEKKDPEAIKKLIQNAGIDPLDIDTSEESKYQEGNHRISDEEVAFSTALDDIKSNPNGVETIRAINTWDQASKDILWKSPELLAVIHSQRDIGIYDRITTEIDRRKILGIIPANAPFIQAYKLVGDELSNKGAFNDLVKPTPVAPIAKRTVVPKPVVTNGAKASAASTTRSSTTVAPKLVNPLAMSDEDFLKQMANRL